MRTNCEVSQLNFNLWIKVPKIWLFAVRQAEIEGDLPAALCVARNRRIWSRAARVTAPKVARCRTFLVQIIPQRVGRTADSPKPPINPRTETGARHLNLTGAAAAQISLATAEKRRCDRGKTFCLARRARA